MRSHELEIGRSFAVAFDHDFFPLLNFGSVPSR
jgi:hypothetical protein